MAKISEKKRRCPITQTSIRRHYLSELRTTMVNTFRGPGFELKEKDAWICAGECMKVIKRNHRRAIKAGYIKA